MGKRIFKIFSSAIGQVCAVILGLLGFSCSDEEATEYLCMYGTPYGTFEAKGSVTDEEGKPVENAEIRFTRVDTPSGVYSYKTGTTNAGGVYDVSGTSYSSKIKVVCVPPGELEADSVIVDLKYSGGDGGWDMGTATFTADFKLKK